MYEEMINKIMHYRRYFGNEYGIDVFSLSNEILMHPKTFSEFVEHGRSMLYTSSYTINGKHTLFGLDLNPSMNVEENNFKFILKNT